METLSHPKVSSGREGSTAAPLGNVQRGRLLHRQGHSTHEESSVSFFPSLPEWF